MIQEKESFEELIKQRIEEILKSGNIKKAKMPQCFICMDTGLVFYKKQLYGYEYEFALHCVCHKGQEYAYEGSLCSKDSEKSFYRIPAVTEIYDVEELKKNNWEKWVQEHRVNDNNKNDISDKNLINNDFDFTQIEIDDSQIEALFGG